MRFLFKALLAATALLPVATTASAQDGRPGRGGDRPDRGMRADRGSMGLDPRGGASARAGGDGTVRADRPADAQRNWTRSEPRQGGWDGRRQDRTPQVAVAPPAPQAVTRPDIEASRDWNRAPAERGRDNARRDNRSVQLGERGRVDERDWGQRNPRNWTSQRNMQQRNDTRLNDTRLNDRRFNDGRSDDRRFDNRGGRDQNWRNDGRYSDRGSWNRTWRNDNRYNWNGYRASNRSAYRLPRYYAPQGWGYGYRRFSIGVTLSSLLWNENYWIDDPYSYRLPEAYDPYRWVRYYDDALLVDVRNGRVVDTVYGIFW